MRDGIFCDVSKFYEQKLTVTHVDKCSELIGSHCDELLGPDRCVTLFQYRFIISGMVMSWVYPLSVGVESC